MEGRLLRKKRVAAVSLIIFLLGGVCGGAYAYITNPVVQAGDNQFAVLNQLQENREVEQFIGEQEKLHPDGLTESQIETGSKYTGITYHSQKNVTMSTASRKNKIDKEAIQGSEKSQDIFSEILSIFHKIFRQNKNVKRENTMGENERGTISIQNGTLNVRSSGSVESNIIGEVSKGDVVTIVAREGNWYQIITTSGLEGYVSATYVTCIEDSIE